MPTKRNATVLECLLCRQMYSLDDVRRGLYFVSTMVCSACYSEMKEASTKVSCFGKKQTKHSVGYSTKNTECLLLCPDRVLCPQFITIKEKRK